MYELKRQDLVSRKESGRNQNRAQSEKTQSVQETGLFTEIAIQWRDNLMVMMKSLQLEL